MGLSATKMKHVRQKAATEEFGQMRALFRGHLSLPETFGATARNRLYTHARVFWIFLAQVLCADGSCLAAVESFLAWLKSATGEEASPNTAAYCSARKKLPIEHIKALHAPLAQTLDRQGNVFWGRRVHVVDGSSLSMPDTQANQKQWPQPSCQKPGCGFPIVRILGVFSLGTGVWRVLAFGALAVGERTLFRSVWDQFASNDIVLADTGFSGFADYVTLERKGVDCVMLNHQRRTKGLRETKKLGKNDRLVEWFKGKNRPLWLTKEEWEELPETFSVREITVQIEIPGFRTKTLTIVTTLRDPEAYPALEIAALYRRRWEIELYFRHIKIAMGADMLRCKSPNMVEKELWMYAIAYNLVRALMLDAAREHGVPIERIGFKGTCGAIASWAPIIAQTGKKRRKTLMDALIRVIARNRVPYRPNRSEPRAKKRRPKNYQLLTAPRNIFKETPHRNKYKATPA